MNATEALLCSLLRAGGHPGAEVPPPDDAGQFIHAARLHGVLPLLGECLARLPNRRAWPAQIATACHDAAIAGAVAEVLQQQELIRVLEGLAKAGIKPLLLKGAALAYSHYPQAALRPRSDTDLLVAESGAAAAAEVLAKLEFAPNHGVAGDFIAYQSSWTRKDDRGMLHHVDLHWRINNAQVLARALEHAELVLRAVPARDLGPHAFASAPVHALLLACMHRAGHMADRHHFGEADHPGGDRLIWLYDIHLLLSRMSAVELDEFVELAAQKRMKAICRDALECTAGRLGTAVPASVFARLERTGAKEPSERLLGGQPAWRMLGDLAAIEGLAGRARWFRELAFPSRAYMRQKYAGAAIDWLPWLYARRAAQGLWRLSFPRRRGRAH